MKVLVADDDLDILESTELLLELEGFAVTTVSDATAILATARDVVPDVLLQDVQMPGLDVAAVVRAIRADATLKDVRVLLFTAAAVDLDVMVRETGADAVVQKPFDPATLGRLLERWRPPKAR